MVKFQKPIQIENDCNSIVDYNELRNAILWYSNKPQRSVKHIFMYGKYPAVSIYGEKIHIHRLLMMYWLQIHIPREYSVHHINENKLDARKENLALLLGSSHNSKHMLGKTPSSIVREKLCEFNHSRKGKRQPFKRADITLEQVEKMLKAGYSIHRISLELGCSWETVKSRVTDLNTNNKEVKYG